MPDVRPNQSAPAEDGDNAANVTDPAALSGESLEGSGFEEEIPDPDYEWRD
jgi:hypothetical protein